MKHKRRQTTMAMMLTGRNLLCHIASLIVMFTGLAIGQQEMVVPGEGACTALGKLQKLKKNNIFLLTLR